MKIFRIILILVSSVTFISLAANAQGANGDSMRCNQWQGSADRQRYCEIKEQTLPAGGMVTVDARQNGGVSIKGWDKNEILLRMRIETEAQTEAGADQLAKQLRIETSGLNIHADGPEQADNAHWSVSFEVFVPRQTDLSIQAYNGGISVADVNGKMDFKTMNGGISIKRAGGSVHGVTTNGGIHIELGGTRWNGESLNVTTTNGGVTLVVPNNYSAHLETGTVNGRVSSDIAMNVPLTERGRLPNEISVELGSGGPTVHASTTNGGVRVTRNSDE